MNLSMRWLSDFVELGEMPIRDYCEAMTMSGSKVEGYEHEDDGIRNVVVGLKPRRCRIWMHCTGRL